MADVMTDLNIRRGLSTVLFSKPGIVNENVIIEEGCWYLCTDTAELFLGVQAEDGLILKPINGTAKDNESVDPAIVQALSEEIEAIRESLNNYVTEQYVLDAIENHDSIAKKTDVLEVKTKLEEEVIPTIQETIIPTVQELAEKAATQGWVQEQSFATEAFVTEKISEIEIPEEYVTESELETKANGVPFTTDKFVTKALGGFTVGESVKSLTIAEILAKLLELADVAPGENPELPDNPDIPAEPDGIVENIIVNKLPMYSVNSDGTVTAGEFELITFSQETAAVAPEKSGFYQIVENGKVIESGYQDMMVLNDEMYYVIALPKDVDYNTMVRLQAFDERDQTWKNCSKKLPLTNDPDTVTALCDEVGIDISHIDTEIYTVWALEDACTGSKLRYIIEEDK